VACICMRKKMMKVAPQVGRLECLGNAWCSCIGGGLGVALL
jgi:hypothetical protein